MDRSWNGARGVNTIYSEDGDKLANFKFSVCCSWGENNPMCIRWKGPDSERLEEAVCAVRFGMPEYLGELPIELPARRLEHNEVYAEDNGLPSAVTTLLIQAIAWGRREMMKRFLKEQPETIDKDVYIAGPFSFRAIDFAIAREDEEAVKALLRSGATLVPSGKCAVPTLAIPTTPSIEALLPWTPKTHGLFGEKRRELIRTLFVANHLFPVSLPIELLILVLNQFAINK